MLPKNHPLTLGFIMVLVFSLPSVSLAATYGGGSGTAEEPYEIWAPEQMNTIGLNPGDWGKHFKLMANIDMSIYTGTQYNIIGNLTTKFTGTFDGNGHVISNLTITASSQSNVGLLGYVGSGGKILNLGVENIGIAGYRWVGGLVGENFGTITSCYATGAVSGTSYDVGGLVGYNSGTVRSCYATGTVSGSIYVGGLVGYNIGPITACYATVTVSGTDEVGGLVGFDFSTITASFWDIETSGQSGSAGGKGLTTAQMKTLSIYQNADWADKNWVINDGVDYPRLAWENTSGVPIPLSLAVPLAGNGTAEDPYLISTAQEFALLSWYTDVLNKHIQLTANLDLSGLSLYPIGDLGPFTGVFDGNGFTVSNAVILQPNSSYVGLFSYLLSGGKILNLGAENIDIAGYLIVGGLAGGTYSGTITACYVTGSVSGSADEYSWVGGLVGNNSGTITSCYATGSVSSSGNDVGGLVGYNSGTIMSCYATGTVSGTSYVGGLVGRNYYGTITASFWDIETSGTTDGVGNEDPDPTGVMGLDTAAMQTLSTFTSAGWDFINETANGTNDYWRMCIDGIDYPRLNWEFTDGDFSCPDGVYFEDLDYYVGQWLISGCTTDNNYCGGADLNYSGAVDLADFAIFAENWLKEKQIIDHILMIEMSLSYDFGEGYASNMPVDYEFDAWMRVDDTVVSGTIRTPGGTVYPAEMETDDGENWLGIGVGSPQLEDLADFTDGEYRFTVVYTNGTSQSTSILFALEDGGPIPPVDQVLVAEYPVHRSTDVPLAIHVKLIPLDNPDWTYGLEWFPVDEDSDALSGGLEELPYTTTTAGPLNLSPNTLYEIELTTNHAIWSTNEDGIPYVVDKDSEVEIQFTTVSEP